MFLEMCRKTKIINHIFSLFKTQWLKAANWLWEANFLILSPLPPCCSALCFHALALMKTNNSGAKSIKRLYSNRCIKRRCVHCCYEAGSVSRYSMLKKRKVFIYFAVGYSNTSRTFLKYLVSFSTPSTTSFMSCPVASG